MRKNTDLEIKELCLWYLSWGKMILIAAAITSVGFFVIAITSAPI